MGEARSKPISPRAAPERKAPGEYPSGGPVPHLLDLWKAGAPSLDMLAPDIYFPEFVDLASAYHRSDNPLFIPEANNADKPEVAANAFYAFGKLSAIGSRPSASNQSTRATRTLSRLRTRSWNVWEGTFDSHGNWIPGRLLNGDQTHQGRHLRLAPGEFQIQKMRLYRYR